MMDDNWHLSKTVTIGNMLTMGLAVLALVGSYYTLDRRIALLESSKAEQANHVRETEERIVARLDRIENLIMRVIFIDQKEKRK